MVRPQALPSALLLSRSDADQSYSPSRLTRHLARGRLIRLRRGVYLPFKHWVDAYPTERFRFTAAATGIQRRSAVLCREAALLLHGVPLLRTPNTVQIRTQDRHQVRHVPQPSMTGGLSDAEFLSRALCTAEMQGYGLNKGLLEGFPTHCVTPVGVPDGIPPEVLEVAGHHVLVEPLLIAAADAVPRLPLADGVVVLDAVLRNVTQDELTAAADLCSRTRSQQQTWKHALECADQNAESAGESLARLRISELGFAAPQLQQPVEARGKRYRVDFEWKDDGVVGEFDGWMKYREDGWKALRREKVREDDIRSTGRVVVRLYWEDLMTPERLERKLLQAGVPRPLRPHAVHTGGGSPLR